MNACADIVDKVAWLTESRMRASRARVPISASLELTRRCNLRCQHCYLGEQAGAPVDRLAERGTDAVIRSIDEWADAGLLFLLITGGDPMVRPDFSAIYRHAAELGILVTVFCNGVLITDAIVDLFRELPPRKVEISIYGATAETYETVTRVPGSHARAWDGIRRLHENGVRVVLKTVLLTLNQHEVKAMADQAAQLNCEFRFDSALFPSLPGAESRHDATSCATHGNTQKPIDLRISPEVAVAHDLASPERRRLWATIIERARGLPVSDRLYPCAAGETFFHADPFGNLSPCLLASHYRYAAEGRAFADVWRDDLVEIRHRRRERPAQWMTAAMRGACTHCAAFNYVETGDEERDSEYMKRTAQLRYEAVLAMEEGTRP